jgi:sugar lactone lactonase YvrE
MKPWFTAAALAAILFTSASNGAWAMDRARFIELNKKGRELAKKKDWQGLRQVLTEIGKELPAATPNYLLRVASVEAHLGHTTEALKWMERYADLGLSYDVASDDDLKPLLSEPGWNKIAARMKQRSRTIMRAEQVCTLPIADLMPEDITFHRASGDFIVSSIRHHSLFRLKVPTEGSKECGLTELPLEDQARRWPVLAVSADTRSNAVWMTPAAMPGFSGVPKEDEGKTALLAVDPASGKTLRRLDLEAGGPSMLGDMSVSRDGTVYVSDGRGGAVYRVRGGLEGARLEKIAEGLFSPQTPVLAADGKRLLVPDYSVGIAVINLAAPEGSQARITYLAHPENIAVTGLDGMFLAGDSLIGIQNGTQPERIVRFRLNRRQTRIESAEIIEQSSERLGEPTHAVAAGGWIYVIANVGWNKVDDHGQLKEGQTFAAPVLLRFREKGRRKLAIK